ncbi:MAG TPA: GldG family protein, partial [Desulfobacterales bacterium]|nr:GldG family protein [Desulfobacterales bacterium]
MPEPKRSAAYLKFAVYLLVVVLVNVAGITLFARWDLTAGRIYSLSDVSRQSVATLSEPLTVNVFYSRNLPPPYNTVEQYLRDLLEEYAVNGNRFFNYRFYDVSAEEGDIPAEARENQKLASTYGIHPMQVQVIEKDEVKFQRAYMGLALIHGDLIEQIPTIASIDGLEYRITTAIRKMNDKISALLRLPGRIQVKLFLSPALVSIAPAMGIQKMGELPAQVERTVKELNAKTYGKLGYELIQPPAGDGFEELARSYNLLALSWPASADGKIPAGKGAIGLAVEYGDRRTILPLIDVVRIPIIGTQYTLVGMEDLGRMINGSVESLIDIHSRLGYLADHGAAPLAGAMPGQGGDDPQAFNNLRELASAGYSLAPVTLGEGPIPEGLECLLVIRPRDAFTEHDLYQLDQFLMRGKSLAFFVDAFNEMQVPGQAVYVPVETGLEKLLEHYGIRIRQSYVLDESCYRQEMPAQLGGGDRPIYFAPLIKSQFINQELPFMRNIRGLVAVKASPVETVPERLQEAQIRAHRVVASSERAWEMKAPINLNPLALRPPQKAEEFGVRPLAWLLEGSFPSYFAGKPIPLREAPQPKEANAPDTPAPVPPAAPQA